MIYAKIHAIRCDHEFALSELICFTLQNCIFYDGQISLQRLSDRQQFTFTWPILTTRLYRYDKPTFWSQLTYQQHELRRLPLSCGEFGMNPKFQHHVPKNTCVFIDWWIFSQFHRCKTAKEQKQSRKTEIAAVLLIHVSLVCINKVECRYAASEPWACSS